MIHADVNIAPLFLPTESGPLFCIHLTPTQASIRGHLLYLHPFAEEMHKSRRMAALQARRLAAAGFAVLQLDLSGCGDSWGDFGDARWEGWIADATCAVQWLQECDSAVPCWLWGLRLGAALAVDLSARLPGIAGVVLWQPVTNGELFLNQFLRIRLASEMLSEGQARTGTRQLREQIKNGEAVEVGGYLLASELAEAIGGLRLERLIPSCPAVWIEVVAEVNGPVAPAIQNVMQAWTAGGCDLASERVAGEPFWTTQEVTECPALLEVTLGAVERLWRLFHSSQPPSASLGTGVSPLGRGAFLSSPVRREGRQHERLEWPVVFDCQGERLLGVMASPVASPATTGVLIVVGGPQYRAGSHRQFTLLARDLAAAGIASLRFDDRGMGDSEGDQRPFDRIDDDIAAAIDALMGQAPGLRSVIIWGLCDAASAALIYARRDPRISGLILLNPWVHTEAAAARVRLTHYYWQRLIQPSLWLKLFSGRFGLLASLRDLIASLRSTLLPVATEAVPQTVATADRQAVVAPDFIGRMLHGLRSFQGDILLILSGNDLTAQEFQSLIERDRQWKAAIVRQGLRRQMIEQANHTFSSETLRSVVAALTVDFVRKGGEV
jgi:exosortase A-associated hydrolase 1/exosortase A-associated hydrolase 2